METTTKSKRKNEQPGKTAQNTLVIQRIFNLPAKTLWLALTNSGYFKKWWGPRGYTVPYSQLETRVGGKYLNCMRGPDGKDAWSTGTVREFKPEMKLVITDSFSDDKGNIVAASEYGLPGDWPLEMQITFELEEADGATKLRLTHEGIPPEMHDECRNSWNESFDKLEENVR
jgi:uncharacterized protein YndB with AHSA1/START domain